MTSIEQIIRAIEALAARPDNMNKSALQAMIAAALADAERRGAEAMREHCARMAEEFATYGGSNFAGHFLRLAAQIRSRE